MAVRRESVRLELIDDFTTPMARAAAAAALLDKNLNSLPGSSVQSSRAIRDVGDESESTSTKMRRGSADIDKFSGRLRLLTDAALVLGPALVPIGAAAVPALTALAAGFGAAAGAAATALLAFNGMGEALESLSAYQLEPTVANLEKMNEAFAEVGPAGVEFARFLNDLTPALDDLQNIARQGLFPGLQEGIESLLPLLPQVQRIVADIAVSLGDLGADAGSALAGDEFREFFDYLESDAAPTMEAFARSTGNVVEGLANLLVAFAPLNRDFTSGMESMTQAFADWTAGLSQTDGFRDFVAYIRESGPQVIALLGSLGNALVDIAVAAAPLGSVVVPVLTALARVLSLIAESPVGPALFTTAAALVTLNRAMSIGQAGFAKYLGGLDATTGGLSRMQRAAMVAGTALAGLAIIDAVQGVDKAAPGINALTNSLLALSETSTSGLPDDLEGIADSVDRLANPNAAQALQDNIAGVLGFGGGSEFNNATAQIEALDLALTNLVNTQGADVAADVLEALASAAGLSESEVADLVSLLPTYTDAAAGAAGATDEYAGALDSAGRVNKLTKAQVAGLNAAMEEQTSIALGAFDAVTQYAQALIEARKQAEKSNAGIKITNEMTRAQKLEVIANRTALSQLSTAWNNQGKAVANNMEKWRATRAEFIETAKQMGATGAEARKLADDVLDIPKQRQIDIKMYGSDEAADRLEKIRRAVLDIPREWSTTYYVNQVNAIDKGGFEPDPSKRAGGGPIVGPGTKTSDSVPILASSGEFMMSAAAVDHYGLDAMFAMNARRLAGGGPVDDPRRTLDDQLAIAQAIQQIMDLRRSLAKDGKDKLEGINRRIAELELRRATKELRLTETRERREARSALRAAGAGLSFDSLLPSDPETVAQGVGSAIAEFQREVEAAGGEWTRELRQWARDMRVTAREYDATQAAIEAETERREALIDTLDEQQSQLDDLNRTMAAFGASVAANFLNDGFNQSRTVTGATSPAVAQMQAQLAAIQSGGGAAAGAQASRLMQQIALLQPGETTLTGLDALRDTLSTDTADATAFTAALRQLVTQGLDPLSGFYSELATSGDLLTAQQLVAAGPGGIDELEALWQQRDAATAELAAMTTQAVYGEQQAALVALIAQTNAAIAASDATLVVLNAELLILGEQVRAGSEAGAALLQPQLEDIEQAINALPRNLQGLIRQAGGR